MENVTSFTPAPPVYMGVFVKKDHPNKDVEIHWPVVGYVTVYNKNIGRTTILPVFMDPTGTIFTREELYKLNPKIDFIAIEATDEVYFK
jgi:hypothetical protein